MRSTWSCTPSAGPAGPRVTLDPRRRGPGGRHRRREPHHHRGVPPRPAGAAPLHRPGTHARGGADGASAASDAASCSASLRATAPHRRCVRSVLALLAAALGACLILAPRAVDRRAIACAPSGPAGRSWAPAGSGLEESRSPSSWCVARGRRGRSGVIVAAGGFGVPALVVGFAQPSLPAALWRRRRALPHGWPGRVGRGIIEELRVRVGSVGRPIPQALLEVGGRGPDRGAAGLPAPPARVGAHHRLRPHRRRAQGAASTTRPPTRSAKRSWWSTRSEATSTRDSRHSPRTVEPICAPHAEAEARQAGARVARGS